MRRALPILFAIVVLLGLRLNPTLAAPGGPMIGVNVLLNQDVSDATLADLATHGTVLNVIPAIDAVTLRAPESSLPAIRAESYVAAADPDQEYEAAPIDTVPAEDFADGINMWNLDAVDVTDFGSPSRTVAYDGSGVYVAVLDTGFLDSWRQYFPEERVAEEYAITFGGGGADMGTVSTQPEKWQHDTNSHGTNVTSTILGYNFRGTYVNGVAPMATVIPVKVLNQHGRGWSSVVARGVVYVADLKAGPLSNSPVIINMSLGSRRLGALLQAALDYAISRGVIIVAAGGNSGEAGMGYPGAYPPVIGVAASGWVGEWQGGRRWWQNDVPDPTDTSQFYITDFSSRPRPDQDLDVAAPGSWVLGPLQLQHGQISYFFTGGTSTASPHVAGIVALMAQKNNTLTAAQAESILTSSAIPLAAGCRTVAEPAGGTSEYCWGPNASGAGLATADRALQATP